MLFKDFLYLRKKLSIQISITTMKKVVFTLAVLLTLCSCGNSKKENSQSPSAPNQELLRARGFRTDIPLDSIRLSDPCIMADKATGMYYMTGTGGRIWMSRDLARW